MHKIDIQNLIKLAVDAKKNSYSRYSNFRVGAALITENNNIFTGTNIENATYGATVCAERTAVFKAISEGERKIKMIAIASDDENYIFPCGICRQVLAEFCDDTADIICSKIDGNFKTYKLSDLLPNAFRL